MKMRIIAAIVAAAFVFTPLEISYLQSDCKFLTGFTQCGLGIASPIYKEAPQNLRPTAKAQANGGTEDITSALGVSQSTKAQVETGVENDYADIYSEIEIFIRMFNYRYSDRVQPYLEDIKSHPLVDSLHKRILRTLDYFNRAEFKLQAKDIDTHFVKEGDILYPFGKIDARLVVGVDKVGPYIYILRSDFTVEVIVSEEGQRYHKWLSQKRAHTIALSAETPASGRAAGNAKAVGIVTFGDMRDLFHGLLKDTTESGMPFNDRTIRTRISIMPQPLRDSITPEDVKNILGVSPYQNSIYSVPKYLLDISEALLQCMGDIVIEKRENQDTSPITFAEIKTLYTEHYENLIAPGDPPEIRDSVVEPFVERVLGFMGLSATPPAAAAATVADAKGIIHMARPKRVSKKEEMAYEKGLRTAKDTYEETLRAAEVPFEVAKATYLEAVQAADTTLKARREAYHHNAHDAHMYDDVFATDNLEAMEAAKATYEKDIESAHATPEYAKTLHEAKTTYDRTIKELHNRYPNAAYNMEIRETNAAYEKALREAEANLYVSEREASNTYDIKAAMEIKREAEIVYNNAISIVNADYNRRITASRVAGVAKAVGMSKEEFFNRINALKQLSVARMTIVKTDGTRIENVSALRDDMIEYDVSVLLKSSEFIKYDEISYVESSAMVSVNDLPNSHKFAAPILEKILSNPDIELLNRAGYVKMTVDPNGKHRKSRELELVIIDPTDGIVFLATRYGVNIRQIRRETDKRLNYSIVPISGIRTHSSGYTYFPSPWSFTDIRTFKKKVPEIMAWFIEKTVGIERWERFVDAVEFTRSAASRATGGTGAAEAEVYMPAPPDTGTEGAPDLVEKPVNMEPAAEITTMRGDLKEVQVMNPELVTTGAAAAGIGPDGMGTLVPALITEAAEATKTAENAARVAAAMQQVVEVAQKAAKIQVVKRQLLFPHNDNYYCRF